MIVYVMRLSYEYFSRAIAIIFLTARVRRQVVLCPPQIAPGEQTLQTAYPRDRQPRFP
jgi:hypothetical protein